jgi:hypothetical protein
VTFLDAHRTKTAVLRALRQEELLREAALLSQRAGGAHPTQAGGLLLARHAVLLEHALVGGLKGHPC